MKLHRFKVAALALAMFAHAAGAALFDDDVARKQIADTNVRLGEVQRQLEDRLAAIELQLKSGGLIDLSNQIEFLKSDIAKLRGQIEVLTYELAEAQKRQRDLYVDLDSRMRRIETLQTAAATAAASAAAASVAAAQPPVATPSVDPNAPSASLPGPVSAPGGFSPPGATGTMAPSTSGSASPGAVSRPSDPAAEQRAYDAALDIFKRGDYSGAIAAFSTFLRANPRTGLSPSAQYWIGNAHFARRDYRAAVTAQRTLIANYPDSTKVPDALLNIASAQSELGDVPGARRTLEEIVARHPQSEAAPKARQRLSGR